MNEENISLTDPDETTADVEPEEIDADWNSAPEENWGTGGVEDEDRQETDGENDDALMSKGALTNDGGKAGDKMSGSEADQSFTLKHLSEVRTVGRDEVITLAQKGLDYDRIRGKFDEANAALGKSEDAVSLLRDIAAAQGTTAEQLMDATRAQLLVHQHGITPALAAERVTAMRASRGNLQPGTQVDAAASERALTEKRQTEIREFISEYGTGVDPKSIPPEVWQSVAKGKTLLASYQAWELKKLRADNNAAWKNTENKGRSAGSRTTFGNQRPRDQIEYDWYES